VSVMAMKRNQRSRNPRQVTVIGQRVLSPEDATRIRLEASQIVRARAQHRFQRQAHRLADRPERLSVANAMLSVEQRLVEALWTLARLPNDRGIGFASRNGVGYLDERADLYANAVANGGWLTTAPRPAPPSARAIDAMHEPLDWLRHLDRHHARIVTLGAQFKRGDIARNIGWTRIRQRHVELKDYSSRYLARIYSEGLRTIVAELTIARARQMS
jgi:hypothetical protein